MTPDITAELAQLLHFTSDVATAIRIYSDRCVLYTVDQRSEEAANAATDRQWLEDCLPYIHSCAKAARSGQPALLAACADFTRFYERYASERGSTAAFDHIQQVFALHQPLTIFLAIHDKAAATNPTPNSKEMYQ